jgi:hypothetical protein
MESVQPSRVGQLIFTALLFLPVSLLAQEGLSHVRVVRLSYVSGMVAVQRGGSSDWAKAMVNTPIEEGFTISTSTGSFAEVEFENGSTGRLGELSKLRFSQLAMDAEGNKLNRLAFEQGYATFHFVPEHRDVYTVKVAGATVAPTGKSEFRTDFDQGRLRIEVFSGAVEITAPSGSTKLGRHETLEYAPQTNLVAGVQHGIENDSWDKWVEARDTQSQRALSDQAVQLHESVYGWDDLDEYGDWAYLPGYGYGWAPYEPAGWAPYSMGLWNWYPSFGWTWTSGEPWGWLPYHYGLWNFDPTFGWFWMPGQFGAWSPALVSWYEGPGWIGWAPYGVGANGVTAVSGGVVQNGQPIDPRRVIRVQPGTGTPVRYPPFRAAALAMLSGTPLPGGVAPPGRIVNRESARGQSAVHSASPIADAPIPSSRAVPGAAALPTSRARVVRALSRPAPATVLMGGDPVAEKAVLDSHQSRWGRFWGGSQPEPLRAHLGTTLGGHFPAPIVGGQQGSNGFRGGVSGVNVGRGATGILAPSSSFGSNRLGATVLPHAGSVGFSQGGMTRGGSDGVARGGSGGFSSGISSQSSTGVSSGGHAASAGGSHH